jgi:hypothetical protein
MGNCLNCNTALNTKNLRALYCSSRCKTAAYRIRIDKTKTPVFCWFCGTEFKIKSRFKFCCNEHRRKFFKRKESNKPIILTIDSKTKIETRRYDKIPEIIQQWKERRKGFLTL